MARPDQDAAGRLLERAGDCTPREMTVRASLLARQNPAYRPVRAAPPGSDPWGRRCIADALFCVRTMESSDVYVSRHDQIGDWCA